MFNINDIERTIKETDFFKGLGTDYFDGTILNNDKFKSESIKFAIKAINKNQIPDYLKSAKLIIISKIRSKEKSLDKTESIMI